MVEVKNVVFEYPGKPVLRDVSFQVQSGRITALVGPNGVGKTTLLRCIAGLDTPLSGSIQVDGIDVRLYPRKVHRVVGYLSDFFGLYEDLTVRQCLSYVAQSHQIASSTVSETVERVAERLELTHFLDKKANTLSRGWRQRLGIAQALIHQPKLLLLDEPASGLDPQARVHLSALFRMLQQDGMTLIVSSHILAELEDYCSDMLMLKDGKLLQKHASHSDEHRILISLSEDAEKYLPLFEAQEAVTLVFVDKNNVCIRVSGQEQQIQNVLSYLIAQGLPVYNFSVQNEKLQDVYMHYAHGDSAV